MTRSAEAYKKIVAVLKRRPQGQSAADLAAAAALPLPTARELASRAADEFRGRLEVTESSEILYSFPRGFTSRYTSLSARFSRLADKLFKGGIALLSWIFKAWILVMLLGYFALFMLIALASLVLSAAGGSSSDNRSRNNSGGSFFLAAHIFDLIIRLWFYSELSRSAGRSYRIPSGPAGDPPRQPLHRAVFSFVFGEKDPNSGAKDAENRALIALLCANRGIISLPEYMAVTGLGPSESAEGILAFCAEFGGYPEATEEGTIVYRFQDILLRTDKGAGASAGAGPGPLRRLRSFSANSKTLNAWFGIINSVNLLFGGYFFYHALTTGIIRTAEQLQTGPRIYGITYVLASTIFDNPQSFMLTGLGIVPLVFSALFWLIPALRFTRLGAENQEIKKRNLRKVGFRAIWEKLRGLRAADIDNPAPECRPRDLNREQEKIIAEMASYSQPEVEADEAGGTLYNFTELERETRALAASRAAVNPRDFDIGKVVFDSE
ncbi:MAG: hypothetical protein LBH51_00250 [Treponema sp.]|jgi:hypothetical protein|nr:hypothetical protein [Treponema sp.]